MWDECYVLYVLYDIHEGGEGIGNCPKDEVRFKGKMVGASVGVRLRLRRGLGSARDGGPSCDQTGQVRGWHKTRRVQSCDVSGTTNGTGTTW